MIAMSLSRELTSSQHVANIYKIVTYGLVLYICGTHIGLNLFDLPLYIFCIVCSIVSTVRMIMTYGQDNFGRFLTYSIMTITFGYTCSPLMIKAHQTDESFVFISWCYTMLLFLVFTYISHYLNDELAQVLGLFCGGTLFLITFTFFLLLRFPGFITLGTGYLFLSLLTFCGFISYDTYEMHCRIRKGEVDYYYHALNIFLDVVNLFIKITECLIRTKRNK